MANKINGAGNLETSNTLDNFKFLIADVQQTDDVANDTKAFNQLNQGLKTTNAEKQIEDLSKAETKEFWINKNIDPKKMGDELLKTHFGFNEDDLKAYKAKYGEYVVNDKKKCEIATKDGKVCVAATSEDVKKWRTENSKVPITLGSKAVRFFQDFRQQRVIDKAVNNISDEKLRNQVRGDLLQITSSDGQNRTEAANRLMYLENGSESDLFIAREAVKTVAAQPENKENAMTNLVVSKIKLDEAIKREDLKGVSDAVWQMNKAVKLVQGQNSLTGEYKKDAKVNRQEAAWINRQAAQNLRSIGKESQAFEREMLARYYEVDDQERKSVFGYPIGEIDRWKKGERQNSVRPVSQAEIDWRDYQQLRSQEPNVKKDLRENKFKYEYKVPKFLGENSILEIGGTKDKTTLTNVPLEREKLSGSLRVTGTTTYKEFIYRDENGKIQKPTQNYNYQYRSTMMVNRTTQSVELNQRGIDRGIKAARGFDLALAEVNRWTPLLADLAYDKSVKRRAMEDQMVNANRLATKLPVPPKPEDLPKEREKLIRMFGNDQKGKILVNEIMRDLEVKSRAFWNR